MLFRRLFGYGLDLALVVCAALGVTFAATGRPIADLYVAFALLVVTMRFVVRRIRRRTVPLARATVVRGAIILAIGITQVRFAAEDARLFAVLGTAVLFGLLVSERVLNRLGNYRPPIVANLPGVAPLPWRPDASTTVVFISLLTCAVGLITLGRPAWWLGGAALTAVIAVALVVIGREKVLLARRRADLVPAAVAAYAPQFLVYTSRPDDASYQVSMWLPYLRRSGLPFVIVTRDRVPAAALASISGVPVIEARGVADLETLLCPSLRAAFYVNASSGNGSLVRYQQLTHIYLGHGDSDKPPSYNPTHAMYDKVFVAGPAAIRRYAAHGVEIPRDNFQIVGRPQVDGIDTIAIGGTRSVAEPVVLYAPTWRGHVEETTLSSLDLGEQVVRALIDRGVRVIFRPHPFSYTFSDDRAVIERVKSMLETHAAESGRRHLWGRAAETDLGIFDCMNASTAMVTDVSSVAVDYLFSGKPMAMVAVPAEPEVFVEEFPVARASYVIRNDLADLGAAIDQMLGPDPLAPTRAEISVDCLGDLPRESYADTFVDAVRAHSLADRRITEAGDVDRDENETGAASERRDWRPVANLLLDDVCTAIPAFAAYASAVLGGPAWLTSGLVFATVGMIAVAGRFDVAVRRRWESWLGFGAAARIALSVSLIVTLAEVGAPPALVVATGVILLAMPVLERMTLRLVARPRTNVVDFPAASDPPMRFPVVLLASALAAIVGGVVLTDLRGPSWLVVVLAAAPVAVLTVLAIGIRTGSRHDSDEERLHTALAQLQPQFAVYFASTFGAAYQIGMWLPFFARIGRPWVIVSRSQPMMAEIAATTKAAGVSVPIIYRPTLRSLDDMLLPSIRAAFYVNNATRNTHLIERREVTHVWLNHGDSEKPACYNPVHTIYDQIFVAGQAGIDRYARHGVSIPTDKFRIVGRPQVEGIEPARPRSELGDHPSVLYAPTWQGPFADSRVYSLPVGEQIVRRLLERGARVIFRPHPFNHRYPACEQMADAINALLAADRVATGREHLWGAVAEQEMSIEDCFNASDAMISDVSAVVSDYLWSDKPFSIVSVGRTQRQLVTDVPAARAAYVLSEKLGNLDQVCDELLGKDSRAAIRADTRRYYLGDHQGDVADGFLSAARRAIDADSGEASAGQNPAVDVPANFTPHEPRRDQPEPGGPGMVGRAETASQPAAHG